MHVTYGTILRKIEMIGIHQKVHGKSGLKDKFIFGTKINIHAYEGAFQKFMEYILLWKNQA